MKNDKKSCPNMNHGKTNPTIDFCPNCGQKFSGSSSSKSRCSEESHNAKRRDRSHFCLDCGKDLK